MAIDLTQALFQSRTRAALLNALLRDKVSDSLSGLARRTGLSQHAVAVEVRNLLAAGLVSVQSIGGADVVQANARHPAAAPLLQLLTVADQMRAQKAAPDLEVKESLAHFGAPLATHQARRHMPLEVAIARGLVVAKQDATVLKVLPVVLVKNCDRLDWAVLKEEARRLKLKSELGMVVELTADVSGLTELKDRVSDLRDHRRKVDVFFTPAHNKYDREVVVRTTPPAARRWHFFVNLSEDSVRATLRKHA